MKYYLIKANQIEKTKFVGEYYIDLDKEPIELTKEELIELRDVCEYDTYEEMTVLDNEPLNSAQEKIEKILEEK